MITDPDAAIALSDTPCSSAVCRSQDLELTDSVSFSSLKRDTNVWRGHGIIHATYCVHGRCLTCGRLFEAAKSQFPILLPELRCVTCEKRDFLQYSVEELTKTEEGFEFAVSVRCVECGNRERFTKMVKGLLSAISIEVGLTGISFKATPATST